MTEAGALAAQAIRTNHGKLDEADSPAMLESQLNALLGNWDDFDETYLAFQRLWSWGHKGSFSPRKKLILARKPKGTEGQSVSVEFMLDIDLVTPDCDVVSEHSLLKLINFRRVFESYINFPSKLFHVEFGCVLLAFFVFVPKVKLAAEFFDLPEETVGPQLIERKLNSPSWNRIRQQFSVLPAHIVRITE